MFLMYNIIILLTILIGKRKSKSNLQKKEKVMVLFTFDTLFSVVVMVGGKIRERSSHHYHHP